MSCLSFPSQPFKPGPTDSFYLDSSFVIAGLSGEKACSDLLLTVADYPLSISPIKLIAGTTKDLLHADAPKLLKALLATKAYKEVFRFRAVCRDVLKRRSDEVRNMLLPYQQLATLAVRDFLLRWSGADILAIDANVLGLASEIVAVTPCETNDALHLALALTAKCSHLITKDADFGRVPPSLRPGVLRVA